MKFYLAHPTAAKKVIRQWQLRVEKETSLRFLNPLFDIEEGMGDFHGNLFKSKELVEADLAAICKADGIVSFVLDRKHCSTNWFSRIWWTIFNRPVYSYGTPMEIYQGMLKEHHYIICLNNQHLHPWIMTMGKKVFRSTKEFERFIVTELGQ